MAAAILVYTPLHTNATATTTTKTCREYEEGMAVSQHPPSDTVLLDCGPIRTSYPQVGQTASAHFSDSHGPALLLINAPFTMRSIGDISAALCGFVRMSAGFKTPRIFLM